VATRRWKLLPLLSVLLLLSSSFGVRAVFAAPGADRDGDGISDVREGSVDTDHDGIPNDSDLDSDNDGIPDKVEGDADTDGTGGPNRLDLDSDGDNIPDSVEAGLDTANPVDSDKDGVPDYVDLDSDGDRIPDAIEGTIDVDADGIPAFRDVDTDGDRIRDVIEAGADPNAPLDTDGDKTPDFRDIDSDNDGLPDSTEATPVPNSASDIDRDDDGVPDDEQRMVPAISRVVYALSSRCGKCPVARGDVRIGAHHHQPGRSVQRHEQLAPQWVELHELDDERNWSCSADEQTDVDLATFRGHVNAGQVVKTLRKAFIDQFRLHVCGFHHLAEWRKPGLCQRRNRKRHHRSTPIRRRSENGIIDDLVRHHQPCLTDAGATDAWSQDV